MKMGGRDWKPVYFLSLVYCVEIFKCFYDTCQFFFNVLRFVEICL